MSDREDKSTRVYVGGLSDGVKKEDLETEFEKFGKLNNVWVAFNPPGFAFIEFLNHDDAETACDNLNGTDFFGSKLRVEIARGKGRRGGFRGSRGGGGSRGHSSGRLRFPDRPGSFRGSRGSRGGRGRFDDYGGRREDSGRYGSKDFRSSSDSFRRGSRDSFRGRGTNGRRFDDDSRFRSRSPARR